ncbi:TBC1 domain family member 5 [Erysiphe neolycopersici]|uniref:TBC1 domain family member 5 n=1 Tax=Erysiphe neolycopersici TaxID=212602 RepID=A0A420HEL2_9PEZI|nr:TBC1 domain family member 5 [Erysiphe neolycopersici]
MPENQFFRDPEIQQILLDILFTFSKTNPDIGYRQGMHELLAPIFWVVYQDAIDSDNNMVSKKKICEEQLMMEVLNRKFIEHDAYTLFSLLMKSAKSFYIMGEPVNCLSASLKLSQSQNSPILVRIQRIYHTYLECLDPELAMHFKEINVLPQIFLIRWIRLIFGREFCFSDLLTLWDALLAEDPSLDLIDMVCVAMLLRVRWQLIEADSSSALKILLNYPSLKAPYNSHELISDGIYLRDNMNTKRGSEIILKYSGKLPKFMPETRETSQEISADNKDEKKKNSSPSQSRFLEKQAGIETLLQEAAKGVINRGQRLGINKVFKEAVGEVKKNMQGFQSNRLSPNISRWNFDGFESVTPPKADIAAMNTRNQQLANMLEQATTDLRAISISEDKEVKSYIVAIEMAIAKIDFVKVYLEDSDMLLQETTATLRPASSTKAKPT